MIEISQLKEIESLKDVSEEALTFLASVLQKRTYQDKERSPREPRKAKPRALRWCPPGNLWGS
jgi:hypothetical protein